MTEATGARPTPSETHPKENAPPPLRLGTREGEVAIQATVSEDGQRAILVSASPTHGVTLTKRGGAHLAGWLGEWARPRSTVKLVGPAEIVKANKISPRTLANWRKHRTFPKPLAELAQGPVWERDAVRTWVKRDRPGPGRPAKSKGRIP